MAECAIAVDGAVLPGPASRAAFFSHAPRGAYTALRLPRPYTAADWGLHVARLEKSLALLQDAGAWPSGESARAQPCRVQAAALDTACAAVAALDATRMEAAPVMLCLLVAPRAGDGGASAPGAEGAGQSPARHAHHPFSTWALATLMQHDPYNAAEPSFAAVVGPPRLLPAAKDSAWVQGRRALEARLPPGAADGLLQSELGGLLEGMITNLFVIKEAITDPRDDRSGQGRCSTVESLLLLLLLCACVCAHLEAEAEAGGRRAGTKGAPCIAHARAGCQPSRVCHAHASLSRTKGGVEHATDAGLPPGSIHTERGPHSRRAC